MKNLKFKGLIFVIVLLLCLSFSTREALAYAWDDEPNNPPVEDNNNPTKPPLRPPINEERKNDCDCSNTIDRLLAEIRKLKEERDLWKRKAEECAKSKDDLNESGFLDKYKDLDPILDDAFDKNDDMYLTIMSDDYKKFYGLERDKIWGGLKITVIPEKEYEHVNKDQHLGVIEATSPPSIATAKPHDGTVVTEGEVSVPTYTVVGGTQLDYTVNLISGINGKDENMASFDFKYNSPGVLINFKDGTNEHYQMSENYPPPYVENNQVMFPIKLAMDLIGGEIEWDSDSATATITYNGETIKITAGSNTLTFNGATIPMPNTAITIDGRLVVPIELIFELFRVPDGTLYYTEDGVTITPPR